jgi:hypothetical protein
MSASTHLRGLIIAGALAAVALALAFATLTMNQSSSSASPHPITRTTAGVAPTTPAAAKVHKTVVKPKPLDANLVAALKAGLPRSIANALALHRVVLVALTSADDPIAAMAAREAQAGALLAGASFVEVSIDRNGGDASALTRVLGSLPVAPATLVFVRPSTLFVTMPGFNDKTTLQQAAINGAAAPVVDPTVAAATAAATATATTTTTTPAAPAVAPSVGSD